MKAKHAAPVEALTGRFDDHHAELARMLLDQVDARAPSNPGPATAPARPARATPTSKASSARAAARTDTQRKARGHIRQLEALGYTVTLTQAA